MEDARARPPASGFGGTGSEANGDDEKNESVFELELNAGLTAPPV